MAKKKPRNDKPFTINLCAVCDAYKVVIVSPGDMSRTIRYCRDCIQQTFGWVQFTPEQRTQLLTLFDRIEALPTTKLILAKLADVPSEMRKAILIGESRRRLMQAEARS